MIYVTWLAIIIFKNNLFKPLKLNSSPNIYSTKENTSGNALPLDGALEIVNFALILRIAPILYPLSSLLREIDGTSLGALLLQDNCSGSTLVQAGGRGKARGGSAYGAGSSACADSSSNVQAELLGPGFWTKPKDQIPGA